MSAFEDTEAWVPNLALPPGQHRVLIKSALSTSTKRTGGPMVELELANGDGNIKDWITTQVPDESVRGSSIGIQQIAALFDAARVFRPKEGEYDPADMRIHQVALNRLAGREVGIVVRNEEGKVKDKDTGAETTKMFARVKGYILPSDVQASTGGVIQSGLQQAAATPVPAFASAADNDDDIPF